MDMVVEKIVHGGWGLCRNDGVVLVPFAVPGDILDVSFGESSGGVAFGWIKEIVKPSTFRRMSACPVFGKCGGCDFDNMSYDCEIEVKRKVLEEDLLRIAGVGSIELERTLVPSSEYGYRNHAQFKVRGSVGFFMRRSQEVVPLPEQGCLLLDPAINDYYNKHIRFRDLPDGGFRVRSNERGAVFQKGLPGEKPDRHINFFRKGLRFRVGIDDFFQVNRFVIDGWLARIVRYLEPRPSDRVLDLYCGSGLISLCIASRVQSVTGIELNGRAVANALFNAKENNIMNARFLRTDAGSKSAIPAADKVIVDPPRSGLTHHLISNIVRMRPAVVVYASCDTATFARDIRRFAEEGYILERMTPVDMFPRTRHLEVVSRIIRDEGP
jgi:23S rRNA (uracil1939-C5)-methyltransferase